MSHTTETKNSALEDLVDVATTDVRIYVETAHIAGQYEMLKDFRLGRIEAWAKDTTIPPDDLRRWIQQAFAEERTRLNDAD